MVFGKMQVDGGFFQIAMPEQQLNGTQVGTGFQEVGGKTVAQCVRMNIFSLETGPAGGMTTGVVDGLGSDGTVCRMVASTWEQPLGGFVF
jgi:hypothetical protein